MKYIITTFFLLIFPVALLAQPRTTPELRKKTFEKAWKTVDKHFYDPKFNGVNWKSVKKQYAPIVAGVTTDAEFYDVIRRMLRELKVSHMDIIVPEKVAPYFSAMANMAARLAKAGASGLVLFNRFLQPDILLEDLEVSPHLVLSTSD